MPPKKTPAAPKENISLGPQVREGKSIKHFPMKLRHPSWLHFPVKSENPDEEGQSADDSER